MKPVLRFSRLLALSLGGLFLYFIDPSIVAAKDKNVPLILATTEWPPYEYSNGKAVVGIDVAIVLAAFERMNIPANVTLMPWARSLKNVKAGSVDAIFTLRKTPDREVFLIYPAEPISISENVFFRRIDAEYRYTKEEDLKGRLIGSVNGYDYGRDFGKSKNFKHDVLRSYEIGFDKLAAGRMDFMICDRVVGVYVLNKLSLNSKITFEPKAYSKFDMFLAFAKKPELEDTAKKFSDVLREMHRDGSYSKIVEAASIAASTAKK